ncbi:MAG TPA: MBL fold metallo-hydrolase [Chloroflexota bacterium]|nr:MBL fold metallo-hydrolase [Chloroflexota bacterium]
MNVRALRERLEHHQPVLILDIRVAESRADWAIPGSLWADAYHAVKRGDYAPLAALDLPADKPIVVVCEVGKTSQRAASYLRSKGIVAESLDGGMQAWSLAWNRAELRLTDGVDVIQVRRTGKGCLSYLVASQDEAVVIDPVLGPDVYRDIAAASGRKITGVVDTHVHADHVSRSRLLVGELGVPHYLPAQERVHFAFEPLRDGDRIPVGGTALDVMHTPGHTWESCTYRLPAGVVFTDDTLFLDGVGRPDLEARSGEAEERGRALYQSLRRLALLAEDTQVLPGHASGPLAFDGVPWAASLAEVRARVSLLQLSEAAFVDTVLARIPPTPPNHHRIVALNETGRWPEEDPTVLEAGANRCAVG